MTSRKRTPRKAARKPARILAYLDPEARNKSLLDLLMRLALRDGADVLALDVLRELPWYVRVDSSRSKKIHDALEHDASAALEKEVEPLVAAGLKVRTRVEWGRPCDQIVREVLREPTQLVLKTAQGSGRGESGLFGSTAMDLFRKCPVPVWVVRPGRSRRIRRVLAAVDPVEPSEGEIDLNRDILERALQLASAEDAQLHVCHTYAIVGKYLLRHRMPAGQYREYVRDVVLRVETAMADLLSGFGLSLEDRRVHVEEGNPGEIVPALVERLKADVLVMGTIARAGVPGLLIGNSAEHMLSEVDCSVLALKPKEFVSPIVLDP